MPEPCGEYRRLSRAARAWLSTKRAFGKLRDIRVRELWELKLTDPSEFDRRMEDVYRRRRGAISDWLRENLGKVGEMVAERTVGSTREVEDFFDDLDAGMRPLRGAVDELSFRLAGMKPDEITEMARLATLGRFDEMSPELRAVADRIVELTDKVGDWQVRARLLRKETREKHRGKYVPLMWDPYTRKETKRLEEGSSESETRLTRMEHLRQVFESLGRHAEEEIIAEEMAKIEDNEEVLREAGLTAEEAKRVKELVNREKQEREGYVNEGGVARYRKIQRKGSGKEVLGKIAKSGELAEARLKQRQLEIGAAIKRGLRITPKSLATGLEQQLHLASASLMIQGILERPDWWIEVPRSKDGEWRTDAIPDGYTWIEPTQSNWMFGKLKGKAIRTDVLNRMRDALEIDSAGWLEFGVVLNSVIKRAAVLGRPRALMNGNLLGNLFMVPFFMPYREFPSQMQWAVKELSKLVSGKEADPLVRQALEDQAVWRESTVSAEFELLDDRVSNPDDGLLTRLDREARRNGGRLSLAGLTRAVSDWIFDLDVSMGVLPKLTKVPGMTLGGGGARLAWWFTDNAFRLAAYRYMTTVGDGGMLVSAARKARGLPGKIALDRRVAAQRILEFYDLRNVPKVVQYARRLPILGPAFISYPFLAWRQIFARGYAVRDPFAVGMWLGIVPIWRGAMGAALGMDHDEVEEEARLAAGGNEHLARNLVPLGRTPQGETYWLNVGSATGLDLLRSFAPWATIMEGADDEVVRGLLAGNPLGSIVARLAGLSPYSGRPTSGVENWLRLPLTVAPASGLADAVAKVAWHQEDLRKGREPITSYAQILSSTLTGVDVRVTGAPGSPLRGRQESKSKYAELFQQFLEEGGRISSRPRFPGRDADPELMQKYRALTRFLARRR